MIEIMVDRRNKGGKIVSREERNSNSELEFMLGNLAMGFDVYDARARGGGGGDVVIGGAFKLSGPSTIAFRRGFTTLSIRERPRVTNAKPIDAKTF